MGNLIEKGQIRRVHSLNELIAGILFGNGTGDGAADERLSQKSSIRLDLSDTLGYLKEPFRNYDGEYMEEQSFTEEELGRLYAAVTITMPQRYDLLQDMSSHVLKKRKSRFEKYVRWKLGLVKGLIRWHDADKDAVMKAYEGRVIDTLVITDRANASHSDSIKKRMMSLLFREGRAEDIERMYEIIGHAVVEGAGRYSSERISAKGMDRWHLFREYNCILRSLERVL